MAIHINLLHEQKTQQKQAERDPLKLGMLAMLVVAMILGGIYTLKQSGLKTVLDELDATKAEYEKLKPRIAQFETEKMALENKVAVQAEVVKRIDERFFWAPAFEVITQQTPIKVQVTGLEGMAVTENVTLTVRGIIADPQPLEAADKLRTALMEHMEKYYDKVTGEFSDLQEHEGKIKYQNAELPAADFAILLKLNRAAPAPAETATK